MKKFIRSSLLLLFFLGVTVFTAYFSFTFFIRSDGAIVVPELIGKDVVYALDVLTDLGLNTKVKGAEYNPIIPKNHIVFQEPAAGEEIRRGRDVRIVISKGEKTIITPKLTGLTDIQARVILEENDLCQGAVSRISNRQSRKGEVISQVPFPGSLIQRGACVDVLVSEGPLPRTMKMPLFIGLRVDDAMVQIENEGLQLGEVEPISDIGTDQNRVVGQEPMDGYPVSNDQPIKLHTNGDDTIVLNGSNTKAMEAGMLHFRTDMGFLHQKVRVRLFSREGYSDIFEDFVVPGQDVWVIIPSGEYINAVLYMDDKIKRDDVYLDLTE